MRKKRGKRYVIGKRGRANGKGGGIPGTLSPEKSFQAESKGLSSDSKNNEKDDMFVRLAL